MIWNEMMMIIIIITIIIIIIIIIYGYSDVNLQSASRYKQLAEKN